MKSKLFFLLFFLLFLTRVLIAQNFEWAKQIGGINLVSSYSMITDDNGNVYIAGIFEGLVDFDPGTSVFNLAASSNKDGFILKLDSSGSFVWVKQISGWGDEIIRAIAVDLNGNLYVTGGFSGDILVLKFDNSGNYVWIKQIDASMASAGISITTDLAANVYITGFFQSNLDFDPGIGVYSLTSVGATDIYLLKLDSAGNFAWVKQMGGTGSDKSFSIAIDSSFNVYSTGSFESTADFDPDSSVLFIQTATGASDIYISKLDSAGNFLWAKKMGGVDSDNGQSLVLDAYNNILIMGNYKGTSDFDSDTSTYNLTSSGNTDVFISKLTNSGDLVWAKSVGGIGNDIGTSMSLNDWGEIYTIGYFFNSGDFDPGSSSYYLTSAGNADIFISKLDSSGSFMNAFQIGSIDGDCGYFLTIDKSSSSIYCTGFFYDTIEVDPGVGTFNLTSTTQDDIFILKFSESTVGIRPGKNINSVKIYPNPTSGYINITLNKTCSNLKIGVKNIYGKEVLFQNYSSTDKIEVNIENQQPGVYLVELKSDLYILSTYKVVKY